MHKVFISYHHDNDQWAKEELLKLNEYYGIFIDSSVDTGDIDENLSNESIRQKIRDDYLKDSTVTILLVGEETMKRKHIDWEIYSSMYDGKVNKKSGILVIQLPSTGCTRDLCAHGEQENLALYPHGSDWIYVTYRKDYVENFPYLPERIIDNLLRPKNNISVITWETIINSPYDLELLIDLTYRDRTCCDYDLNRRMRGSNS
jgi:hypothetical protein